MNVLSLFDGMSCGQLALMKAGIEYENYFASEIDKYAIKVSIDNFPKTIHLGDVSKIEFSNLSDIGLLLGGSPCQGFSFAGKQLNFDDPRSKLFFEYVKALKKLKPKYFLLENVVMKKEYQDVISEHLGVQPIEINSALVSAQNRKRLYWTNIPGIYQPEDKKIYLKDVLETEDMVFNYSSSGRGNGKVEGRYTIDPVKAMTLTATGYSNRSLTEVFQLNSDKSSGNKQPYNQDRVYSVVGKSPSLTASFASRTKIDINLGSFRRLTVLECKRLQTVPDDYIMNVSDSQAYKMLGNGWTVDVIAHILKNILEYENPYLRL